tara:strand:- start:884 stop:1534 length:651 start_codon:yes stop_codon:yes gene_type:complete
MNEIETMLKHKPYIFINEDTKNVELRFNKISHQSRFYRVLTTFSNDKITKKALNKDCFIGFDGSYHIKERSLLSELANSLLEQHLECHQDEHNGEDYYVNDMETQIAVNGGKKSDTFYLDFSVAHFGTHWKIVNEQGQFVSLHQKRINHSSEGYEIIWSHKGQTTDFFVEKYDFDNLMKDLYKELSKDTDITKEECLEFFEEFNKEREKRERGVTA